MTNSKPIFKIFFLILIALPPWTKFPETYGNNFLNPRRTTVNCQACIRSIQWDIHFFKSKKNEDKNLNWFFNISRNALIYSCNTDNTRHIEKLTMWRFTEQVQCPSFCFLKSNNNIIIHLAINLHAYEEKNWLPSRFKNRNSSTPVSILSTYSSSGSQNS